MNESNKKNIDQNINGDQIKTLCEFLVQRFREEEQERRNAKTKEVLALIGKGLMLAAVLFAPNMARILPRGDTDPTWAELDRYSKMYNIWSLKRTIRRLQKQRMVSIEKRGDQEVLALTEKGKKRILQISLDELSLKDAGNWDGKWRLVIYDISDRRRRLRDVVRETLIRLNFLKIQESVFITPHPCFREIEFLRTYYGLRDEINILEVSKIEFEKAYRDYFGL